MLEQIMMHMMFDMTINDGNQAIYRTIADCVSHLFLYLFIMQILLRIQTRVLCLQIMMHIMCSWACPDGSNISCSVKPISILQGDVVLTVCLILVLCWLSHISLKITPYSCIQCTSHLWKQCCYKLHPTNRWIHAWTDYDAYNAWHAYTWYIGNHESFMEPIRIWWHVYT